MTKAELIKFYKFKISQCTDEIELQELEVDKIKGDGRLDNLLSSDYIYAKMLLSKTRSLRASFSSFVSDLEYMKR